jgi:hypothetical protein
MFLTAQLTSLKNALHDRLEGLTKLILIVSCHYLLVTRSRFSTLDIALIFS